MPSKASDAKSSDIRDNLLDTAERLFSERSIDGVSIRDITNEAGVRLAAVNYHFGSKENLLTEIIKRRSDQLIGDRHIALEAIEQSGLEGEQKLRAIVDAFIDPVFRNWYQGGQGWRNYCRLAARISVAGTWSPTSTIELFNPTSERFIQAIKQTFPDMDEYTAHQSFLFMLSNLLFIMIDNKRLDRLSDGEFSSDDLIRVKPVILNYIVGGIMALVKQP